MINKNILNENWLLILFRLLALEFLEVLKIRILQRFQTPSHGQCPVTDKRQVLGDETLSRSELWSCVKVEVAVLGSPSLISLMVSVDVKQH